MATACAPIQLACEKRWDIKLIWLEIENEHGIYQNFFLYRGWHFIGVEARKWKKR